MHFTFSYKGRRLSYTSRGEGSALVFLHGFLENKSIWDSFADVLSASFRVLQIDLPGHGDSDVIADCHSMELMADAVAGVCEHEGVEDFVLIGHSMGGYVSLALLRKFPQRVKALVLFHSHASADTPEASENRLRTIEVVKKEKLGFINSFIPALFAPANIQKYQDDIDKLRKQADKISKESVIAALKGMSIRESGLELLAECQQAVFFIIGKQDSRIPLDKIMAQAMLPKHSEVLLLDNVGHMGYIEARTIILNSLAGFVKRVFDVNV